MACNTEILHRVSSIIFHTDENRIKSEIHSCTIEVIRLLEQDKLLDFNFLKILEDDKELRIDNQYYLKNRPVDFDSKAIGNILLKIRNLLDSLTEEQITKIRNLIKHGD